MIGMFVFHTSSGLGSRSDASLNFNVLDDVVTDLGGKLITSVSLSDSYSLLTKKGENYWVAWLLVCIVKWVAVVSVSVWFKHPKQT